MSNGDKSGSESKLPVKVSIFHLLLVLMGANVIVLLAPDFGMLNSFLYIPDIYTWSSIVVGLALIVTGFKGLYKSV